MSAQLTPWMAILLLAVGCKQAPPPVPAPPAPEPLLFVTSQLDRAGVGWFRAAPTAIESFPGPEQMEKFASITWESPDFSVSVTGSLVRLTNTDGASAIVRRPDAGWLVLVVDDVGFNMSRVRQMLDWNVPVIFAILPRRPFSADAAAVVAAAGRDVYLHQPMEPRGYPDDNPGRFAIYSSQSTAQIRQTLAANLDSLPGVKGLNNHMGSAFTADLESMDVVAAVAVARQLVLIDSLTTGRSAVGEACGRQGTVCAARDVFIDHERAPAAVDRSIATWQLVARRQGLAIALAHPHQVSIDRIGHMLHHGGTDGLRLVGDFRLRQWLQWKGQ